VQLRTAGLGFELRDVKSEGTLDQLNSSNEVTNGLTKSEAADGASVQDFRPTLLNDCGRRHCVNAQKRTGQECLVLCCCC
jgi:hypothetical protein